MNDLISRQAAIEALQNHYEVRNPKQNAIMDECVMLISNVPSAQPELIEKTAYIRGFEQGRTQGMIDSQGVGERWIPCKLKNQYYIPELNGCKDKPYLVTYETATGKRYVTKTNIHNGRVQRKENRIIAWMPLPEPYKGGEEGQCQTEPEEEGLRRQQGEGTQGRRLDTGEDRRRDARESADGSQQAEGGGSMNRYIDAMKLTEDIIKKIKEYNKNGKIYDGIDALLEIMGQPTADVVEVVRCKDCKNCEVRTTANHIPFFFCKLNDHSVSENAFCCWGERTEE